MNKDRIIFISRILLVAGIVIIAFAVFSETWDVARLSSLKASKAQLEYDRKFDFLVEEPIAPVNEKYYIVEPDRPGIDATDEEKAQYEKLAEESNKEKERLENEFKAKQEKYTKALKDFNRKNLENRRKLVVSDGDYRNKIKQIGYSISQKEIDINKMWFPLLLRFLGSFILLLGSLGMLMYGEVYERLGVLVLLGFAFKTIVGL